MLPTYPSLGVLYLASMLEKLNHDVELIDMDIDNLDSGKLLDHIDRTGPQLVGFSCITPTANLGFGLAREVKERFPNIHTIMGGIHPTIDPDNSIAQPGLDFISIGESEHTICELVDVLGRDGEGIEQVKGIYYIKNGKVHKNAPREMEHNLDSFPFPAFHLIKDLKRYSPPDAQTLPVAPMMTSRGCPGKCTYCCTKQIFGNRFRARSVQNILEEIDYLVNQFGIRELHFMDDNIATNRKRILELCKNLKERNYPIRYELSNGIRADMVDREILQSFRDIGMVNIGLGVESGNEEILKVIKKGIDKDQVRKVMKIARELGFETWAFFIVGLYKENEQTIQDTIDFAIELDPDFAKFLVLKPFPGSEIFKQLQSDGLIDCYDYSRYGLYTDPVHHLHELSALEILKWQKRAFRKFYLRPGKILRHVTRIRSLTQLKIAAKGALFVIYTMFRNKILGNKAP